MSQRRETPVPLSLSLYRGLTRLVPLAAPIVLRRRLARGKEDPDRWTERLGVPGAVRPDGPVVWLNGVGLGEVLALRALIAPMAEAWPQAHFLVTSTARTSARAFAGQAPARTVHQYLPLDAPPYLARFMDHWRPDLCIWTDQDLWPGAIATGHARGIPQAWVNGRMNAASRARWSRAPGLLAALVRPMSCVSVQDAALCTALHDIGIGQAAVGASLKQAAPVLDCDPGTLAELRRALGRRGVWVTAPSHAADEAAALAAQRRLRDSVNAPLLILAPRDAGRGDAVAQAVRDAGLTVTRRSTGAGPGQADVYVADTTAEMGLWYRLADVAFIGGTLSDIEGHNPWEAIALGCPVLHGGRTANFERDYAVLAAENAARRIEPADLAAAVLADPGDRRARGLRCVDVARDRLRAVADGLVQQARR